MVLPENIGPKRSSTLPLPPVTVAARLLSGDSTPEVFRASNEVSIATAALKAMLENEGGFVVVWLRVDRPRRQDSRVATGTRLPGPLAGPPPLWFPAEGGFGIRAKPVDAGRGTQASKLSTCGTRDQRPGREVITVAGLPIDRGCTGHCAV